MKRHLGPGEVRATGWKELGSPSGRWEAGGHTGCRWGARPSGLVVGADVPAQPSASQTRGPVSGSAQLPLSSLEQPPVLGPLARFRSFLCPGGSGLLETSSLPSAHPARLRGAGASPVLPPSLPADLPHRPQVHLTSPTGGLWCLCFQAPTSHHQASTPHARGCPYSSRGPG